MFYYDYLSTHQNDRFSIEYTKFSLKWFLQTSHFCVDFLHKNNKFVDSLVALLKLFYSLCTYCDNEK